MTNKKAIKTDSAPDAVGPYSQAIKVGNLLFTSGQLPIDPSTGQIPQGTISVRAHQTIKNLAAVIEAAGAGLEDVVKTTVFLTDISDFQEINKVYEQYFARPFPARSAFQVAALPLAADIEIEAIVFIN
ncbi:RidA family protein [Desulfofustis glycolicus]|uniref:Endoribonuclease L-PSP n=1 Tax=Desulfofustis glycolicus DSM 9705 TaxID=1121409 RepID=A0A1M5XT19_9BACT|nr:RidA family protein [Desulfofustis glycolicus]MCB2217247.1 RidA family protein [Desulfobulbaceae bacterium]SHI02975.1 endoribonuclease L-PSP [Desulfofustis glycolicus DSM 9705]